MTKPLLLFAAQDDAEFLYACHFNVEAGLYFRFAPGDDLLVVPTLEVERARNEGRAARIADRADLGWAETQDTTGAWAQLAQDVLRQRGVDAVRISGRLPAAAYEALRDAGIGLEIERGLFGEERRRKSAEEASFIHSAQRAAEAACAEVISLLAVAESRDGLLWLDGRPLTSERLMARAQSTLNEIGYQTLEMIIAGSPESAVPHFRGAGQLRANAPIIIDIFPRGSSSHYHGDLTRTVVVGEPTDAVRQMHEVCVAALEGAVAAIREGANGRDIHHGVCRLLVERGYGTTTKGFEGRPDGPRLNHATGHGVGLEVHEGPQLRDLDCPLQAGDVVTVEPGLYHLGVGGVRVEDTGIVTRDGFRNFTSLPRSLDPLAYL